MEIYARADLLICKDGSMMLVLHLDSISTNYPGHALEDEILVVLGDLAMQEGDIDGAIEFYNASLIYILTILLVMMLYIT